MAVCAVPGGDAMAPPELAADAPVVDVLHPVEIGLLVFLGGEVDRLFSIRSRLDGGDGYIGEGLNLDEPLRGEARLYDGFAAVAVAYVADVILDAREELPLFQILDYLFTCSITVKAGVRAAFGVDVAGIVHHVNGGKIVTCPKRKVVGIVGRGYFHRASAEFEADPFIEDDGDFAGHQRKAELF